MPWISLDKKRSSVLCECYVFDQESRLYIDFMQSDPRRLEYVFRVSRPHSRPVVGGSSHNIGTAEAHTKQT